MALVCLKAGRVCSEQALISFVRSELDDYKVPERIFFVQYLRRNPRGKLDRLALRLKAQQLHEQSSKEIL